MTDFSQIEKEGLELSAPEREQLALKMWESLTSEEGASSDGEVDPEGIELATSRDAQITSDDVTTLSGEEFRQRTGGELRVELSYDHEIYSGS